MIKIDLTDTEGGHKPRWWISENVMAEDWWWDDSKGYFDYNVFVLKNEEDAIMFRLKFNL